jgi:signal transduction histidine kinase
MHQFLSSVAIFLMAALPTLSATEMPSLAEASIGQLEQRLSAIDSELEDLARFTLVRGYGAVGYSSKVKIETDQVESIQINLEQATPIDQIVLVPTIARDSTTGLRADGFPLEFRLLAGTHPDTTGQVVASFDAEDQLLPRIAPLIVPCSIRASWIRLETSRLSERTLGRNVLELRLSEIMVFNGEENVALRRPVQAPEHYGKKSSRSPRFLTDGLLPYIMDTARGKHSLGFYSLEPTQTLQALTIDLERAQPLDRIHLYPLDQSNKTPLESKEGIATPRRLRIEGGLQADLSDAKTLLEVRSESLLEVGPIMMYRFPETRCRYVRLTVVEPYAHNDLRHSVLGYAEIELYAESQNVARGKTFTANFTPRQHRPLANLTDGANFYGDLLPIRVWVNELARRHDLEKERPLVAEALNQRYLKQKGNLQRMSWLAVLFAVGIIITMLFARIIGLRKTAHLKGRLAADLHDELGANINSIQLLSEFAKKSQDTPEKQEHYLNQIRAIAERTSIAVRDCSNMLEAGHLFSNLKNDMQRAAKRVVTNLEHEFSIEGESYLGQLSPRIQVDLVLFYKEALINISRHAGASHITTRLVADPQVVHLTISDDGRGILDNADESPPDSLRRRAGFLKAELHVESSADSGTCIQLTLNTKRSLRTFLKRARRKMKNTL